MNQFRVEINQKAPKNSKQLKSIRDWFFDIIKVSGQQKIQGFSRIGINNNQKKDNQIMQKDQEAQKVKQNAKDSCEGNKRNKKKANNQPKLPVTVPEQVVFSLIFSIHHFTSQFNQQNQFDESKEKKQKQQVELKLLQRNGIKRSQINQIIYGHIKCIPYNTMNDVKKKLRSSLHKIYLKKTSYSPKQPQQLPEKKLKPQVLFQESIKAYTLLSALLKQASIPTPIQEGFYHEYNQVWKQMIENAKQLNQRKEGPSQIYYQGSQSKEELLEMYDQGLLQIWRQIPHQSLNTHLSTFNLNLKYAQLPLQLIICQLSILLVENKIQQCCTYYETYFLTKYQIQTIPLQKIITFEDEVLIPKITKSQHIFSSHVLSLFKSNPLLKQRFLNSLHLDPAIGVRIVDLLKQDGRKYANIHMYCLKQHYKSVIYDHKYWWIVEDKLSFNKNFIEWYTQEFLKAIQDHEQNDRFQKIANQIKDIGNLRELQLSLLKRNNIIDLEHSQIKDSKFKQIPNPLYEKDRFDCSELIIKEIAPEEIENSDSKYLKFQEHGVRQQDVKIIDLIDDSFEQMSSYILKYEGKPIGFDTEFRCVSTKYEQQGVSLIQLSTSTKHYIIDFLKLENCLQFHKFIVQFLCNQKYIKVGHTISSDIKYLTYTLHLPQTMFIKSFVDITQIFKTLHPNQKFSSLSFLCLKFLNRKLSKYEQRSNWNRRPLRKAQLHYAALDAFACVLIYDKLFPEYQEILKNGKLHNAKLAVQSVKKEKTSQIEEAEIIQKQPIEEKFTHEETSLSFDYSKQQNKNSNNFVGDFHRSESFVYHKKFQKILSSQEPKFLVDNMLKKLSAIMRNCGIDAEYIAVRDYQLASAIAQKQSRIILTRDTKFFQRKDNKLPIYLIKEKTDSEKMFEEITQFFKIDLSLFTTLSRCVKCNGPQLIIIETQEAMKEIKFKYQDSTVSQFWRCTKCKQIYWQGGQFQRAKQKYTNIKKQ